MQYIYIYIYIVYISNKMFYSGSTDWMSRVQQPG